MPPRKVTPRGTADSGPKAPGTPVTPPTTADKPRVSKKTSTLYARNLFNVEARITLDTGRRMEFRPRGERGDCLPVNKEEQEDAKLLGNVGLIIELISAQEAQQIIGKQATNQQSPHGTFDQIRDELGNPMQRVIIEEPYERQGKVVAGVEQLDGKRGQQQRESIVRDGFAPQVVERPGSPGTLPDIPADVAPEDVADWAARNLTGDELARLRVGLNNLPHRNTDG